MPVLRTAILRYEHESFKLGINDQFREGTTFGMMVDKRITNAVENNETLHEITIQFEPEEWSSLCTQSTTDLRSRAKKL